MALDQRELYRARLEFANFLVDALADAPTKPFVETLLGGEIRVPDAAVGDALDAGFAALTAFVDERADRDPDAVREALQLEYSRLFVGPRPPILPHETHYRDDTDYLGDGLARVKSSYAAVGWTPADDYPEEADHVAVELAFVRRLVRRQRDGDRDAFGYQRVFHEEHLDRWVDDCAADVVEHADSTFYEAVGHLLSGYVEFESEIAVQMG
ncbi:TorD/DmsD family molecular chaperone [Halegenticoccus tardaugens]|uniref:TorD/DmsD family molecular chaperone n=1 Tax=Halegenticoccus tardaugens TaxID=2071624 RepID=UPI00100B049F|nr:molecular chaperone TorD family protein [Halegenticoccus tardaugens]